MSNPNPHNSPLNAYRVTSAWKNFPKGLINSQVGIISTYYPDKNTNSMKDRQVTAFSKRLHSQAHKVWDSLTLGEKEVIKALAERTQEPQDLEKKISGLLYQNEISEDSQIMPDVNKVLYPYF